MSYNKAKEERRWKKWKNKEEKLLRDLGVTEDIIQQLHTYDWEVFKAERNYQEKLERWIPSMDLKYAQTLELPVKDIESFLDDIENEELFYLLAQENYLTIQILFYKIMGYTSKEIAEQVGIKENAIDQRVSPLKKKL